jgi:hypothetical protein
MSVSTLWAIGPGRPRSCLLGLPQIRACPIKAHGSSRSGLTSRHAIRWSYVDSRSRLDVLGLLPTIDSTTRRLLPSTGSPRLGFPAFPGTMRRSDSLAPSRRASLSFAWRYHNVRRYFALAGPERATSEPGVDIRSPAGLCVWRIPGRPKFLGSLRVPTPCSPTPAGPTHQAIRCADTAPALTKAKARRG